MSSSPAVPEPTHSAAGNSGERTPAAEAARPSVSHPGFTAALRTLRPGTIGLLVGLTAVLLWSYWPVLAEMAQKWTGDPQYSHAYLVPIFSLFLLWSRSQSLAPSTFGPSWWGLSLLAVGVLFRLAGAYVFLDWLEGVSLIPLLAGATLLLAGPQALRWSWPAIGFLVFMVPLPFRVETALSHPLQRLATQASTYALQTLGQPAFAEGNVIVVNEARLGVAEACNGLGMLLLFFALATGVAMVARCSLLEKALIVLSAAPVAVAANVTRITVTSFLYEIAGSYWADLVFHDLAGWLMMPLALGMLWLELWVLGRLFVDAPPPQRAKPLKLAYRDDKASRPSRSRVKAR